MKFWAIGVLFCLACPVQAVELVVYNWPYYLAPEVKQQFQQETGDTIREIYFDSDEARNRLLAGNYPSEFDVAIVDNQSLNDLAWADLFQTLPAADRRHTTEMDPKLVAHCGPRALPYFWGSVGIAYRASQVSRPITRWQQLLEPEPALSGRIVMVDDSFDLISVALKTLGHSINSQDKRELQQAYELLKRQQPHVAAYRLSFAAVGDEHLKQRIAAAMVYSGDYYALLERSPFKDWHYVTPEEGSPLWLDCLTILKTSHHPREAARLLEFLTRPDIARLNGERMNFTPPLPRGKLPASLVDNPVIYPPAGHLAHSELYAAQTISTPLRNAIYFSVIK